jgi:hypothetical protein
MGGFIRIGQDIEEGEPSSCGGAPAVFSTGKPQMTHSGLCGFLQKRFRNGCVTPQYDFKNARPVIYTLSLMCSSIWEVSWCGALLVLNLVLSLDLSGYTKFTSSSTR